MKDELIARIDARNSDPVHIMAAAYVHAIACEALLERYRIMVAADGIECLQAIAAIAKARGAS